MSERVKVVMTVQEVLEELESRRLQIGEIRGGELPDAAFVREFLPYSVTTWSRMRSGTYAGDASRVVEAYQGALDEIDARLPQIAQAAAEAHTFLKTTFARAVLASATRARDARRQRITIALSETGAGKTTIGRYMESKGAIYVEGRRSWRASYKAFCADVSAAAGRRMHRAYYSERDAESAMLTALGGSSGVLYIDEANTLGPAAVDALKLIVNTTARSIVVAAIPSMWDRLAARAEEELRQLVNRCQPVIRYSGVTAADVGLFLRVCGLPADGLQAACKAVAEAASGFGGYSAVAAIRDELRELRTPTADDLATILRRHATSARAAGIAQRG